MAETPTPPDYYEQFLLHLDAIEVNTKRLTTLIPAEFARQTNALLDVYKNAGPSRPLTGPAYRSTSGYSTLPADAELRAELNAAQERPGDPTEASVEGRRVSSRQATKRTWRDRVQLGSLDQVLPLPRFPGAQLNTADLLNYLSTLSANMAQRPVQKVYDRWRTANKIDFDAKGQPIGPLPQDMQQELSSAMGTESRFGGVSDFFAQAESGYAQMQAWKGILGRMAKPYNNLTNVGYQMGQTSPEGFMGIRFPWDNNALSAGIGQKFDAWSMALHQGISPSQANFLRSQLRERGWFGGSQSSAMQQAAAQMFHQGYGSVASQPAYYDMMDKATRQGAASLQHFNDVMRAAPDAMKAAHLGLQQVMSDADQLGQLSKSMGGTYLAGVQRAIEWNGITGQPADILAQLAQNPLVQGQTFMRTGLMPWEQGLASTGQQMGGIMSALGVLNSSILIPNEGLSQQIGNSGFYNSQTPQQQKEALISHFLGVSPEVVHSMLGQRGQWMARSRLSDEANAYSQQVTNAVRTNDPNLAAIFGGQGRGHWGQVVADLKTAGLTRQQIEQIQNVDGGSKGHWAYKTMSYGRGQGSYRQWVGGQSKKDAATTAWDRAWLIKHDLAQQQAGNASTGPKLTIELGPAAKKAFHLVDPNAQQKANANAGSASVDMNSWANGPTTAPFPDLTTAGSPTYGYGSQYATGTGSY